MHIHNLTLIHLDRHLGCLHILFIMNNDVGVQRSLWESWFEFFWIYTQTWDCEV